MKVPTTGDIMYEFEQALWMRQMDKNKQIYEFFKKHEAFLRGEMEPVSAVRDRDEERRGQPVLEDCLL